MISWIQVTFQKHTKLFLVFLFVVVAIPFVFTIGAAPGIGKAGHKVLERPFFGYNLGSPDDQKRIIGDAELSVYLQAGFMALNGAQLQDYAMQRIAALHLADTYGVPEPSAKQLTDHLATLRVFQNANGQFDSKRYAEFTDSLKNNPQISRADVARVMAGDVRLAQVQDIVSGPGYVLSPEIRSQVVRAGTEWTVSVASVDFSTFTPDVAVGELSLAAFFEENMAPYQAPARVSVDYVVFQPSAHVAEVSVTDAELLAFYKANPARFPGAGDAIVGVEPDSIPLALRSVVENTLRTELAAKQASKVASDFAFALFDRKIVRDSVGLSDLLTSYKLTRQTAPRFAANETPAGLGWPANIAQEAFKLSEKRYFSNPFSSGNGSTVVMFWTESFPAYTPSLAEVREAVVRDYTTLERRKRFVEAGAKWRAELQSKIAGGMTLQAAAATFAAPKFEVTSFAAFPRRQPPENFDASALAALENTSAGEVSGFIPTGQKGLLVHVVSKKAPEVDESSAEFANAQQQISRMTANLTQNLVLAELVERELQKSEPSDR